MVVWLEEPPVFVVRTVNCVPTNYVLSLTTLITSNIFPFQGFCFHNFRPPLEKSWLRPCAHHVVSVHVDCWTT